MYIRHDRGHSHFSRRENSLTERPNNARKHKASCKHASNLIDERTLRPGAQDGTPLVRDEGDHAEDGAGDREDQTGVLAADVVEELAGEERGDGAEGVTQETLTGDGGGGGGAVAVGGVGVGGLEDEVDAEGDGCQGNGGGDPVHVAVLGEGVDEEADGQPDGAVHGTVEAVFGGDGAVGVGDNAVVLLHLPLVGDPAESAANAEGNVRKACNTLVPAALLLEGDGDDAEEHEGDEPCESDPQAESKHHWLGDKHLNGFDGGVLEEDLDTRGGDVVAGDVALVVGGLADQLGTLVEGDTAASLGEEDDNRDEEGHVGNALNTLDPSPANGHVDETGVDGSTDRTEDGDP